MTGRGTYSARVAALGIMQSAACAKLLRAHGRHRHADNFEAALNAFIEIVAGEVGRDKLTAAMNWAANQAWGCDGETNPAPQQH